MANLPSELDLVTLPKVELHLHLNGAISEATAATLAERYGEDPERALRLVDGHYPYPYSDFDDFLDAYLAANSFVRDPDDLEVVAAEFARAQAAQNVVYSEAQFTAMILVRQGMEPRGMWAALKRGLAAAGAEVRIGLIVDVIRNLGREEAEATLRLVEEADAPIVGLGVTGVEGSVPITEFVEFRAAARRLGLGFTIHAGETGADPVRSMVESLDILETDRIGHGVAAVRDQPLLERLVRDQVPLEVCPSSNVGIGLFPTLEAHPVVSFWTAGVNLTVSSDDPPFFGITMIDELRNFVRLTGATRDDLAELQRRGARASFADEETKARLLSQIDAWAESRDAHSEALGAPVP